ncbi:MAG: hypothetical protein F2663_09840 [Actinobacteria bacterium]|nr:hypothetical protein [Actinomycetota bacterium]
MDAPLNSPHELVRPWRRATIIASLVAAIELVLLLAAAAVMLAKPVSHAVQRHAAAAAFTPAPVVPKAVVKKAVAIRHAQKVAAAVQPKIMRTHLHIAVLNGNGRHGAAAAAASRLQHLGYKVASTGNAKRQDYASSVVMYRPGFAAEGRRLARDLGIKVVGPIDGVRRSALHGGQLAIILGA